MQLSQEQRSLPRRADVVIVGSGPVGAAFAAEIALQWPGASILMLEAGPLVPFAAGGHFSNLDELTRRDAARLLAQGPRRGEDYAEATEAELALRRRGLADDAMRRRPGLFPLSSEALDGTGFPAAQASSVVGGMGTQWFGACPRPAAEERVPFIDRAVMDDALARAETHLKVAANPFPPSAAAASIRQVLGDRFDAERAVERRAGPMPMALRWQDGRVLRTGIADILGNLIDADAERFQLVPDIVARRLLVEGQRVTGVECASRLDGRVDRVEADFVFVAGDSLRTPQLLYASGIRPPALGRHLNEHPLIIVDPPESGKGGIIADSGVLSVVSGVEFVPYIGDEFPYEIEVTLLSGENERALLNIHTYTHSDISFDNRVIFSDDQIDWLGLPGMHFHYVPSEDDRRRLREGVDLLSNLLRQLGVRGGPTPRIAPCGASLHYQGTVRMGATDDGTSVCDQHGRVWGFSNLFVGGNGVIPTKTAANPTLSAVSLSVLSADAVARSR